VRPWIFVGAPHRCYRIAAGAPPYPGTQAHRAWLAQDPFLGGPLYFFNGLLASIERGFPYLLFHRFERESDSSNGSRIPYPPRTGGGDSREGGTRMKAELA